jgi:hypothetical protein
MRNLVVALAVAVALGAAATYLHRPADPAPVSGVVNAPDAAPVVDADRFLRAFPLEPLPAPPALGESAADRALDKALTPYRAKDYAGAASALDQVLLDFPGDPRAVLYLGVARLLSGEPQNALEILGGMPASSAELAAEAEWYTLVGIARLRDPRDAADRARRVCRSDGLNKARACGAVTTLSR